MLRLLRYSYLAPALLLLGCGSDPAPSPRLDFISVGQLLTADRVANPGDTLSAVAFAETAADEPLLRRFTITVQYSSYDQANQNRREEPAYTYLDTVLSRKDFLWPNRFMLSTNSGRETWVYTAEDASGRKASRSLRLTTRQNDSIRTWHSYSVRLQNPTLPTRRAGLVAERGTAVPAHALAHPDFQRQVDVLFHALGSSLTLASPADASVLQVPAFRASRWLTPRRATGLKLTALTGEQFTAINTDVAIRAAVAAAGALNGRVTGLAKNQVVAFRTQNEKEGLLVVRDITATAPADLILDVKVVR